MSEEYRSWLEEVWDIKERIAKETRDMTFQDYWKFLQSLAKEAEREIESLRSQEESAVKSKT